MPTLSLVICSRNDDYSGNSLYRLQTSLNYLAFQVSSLDLENEVEVIVTDWGSEVPLRHALALTSHAARITRFLEVPPELARDKQRDSPFAEVLANNAAIRRASGTYIGRIDQDTLVGRHFLRRFFDRIEGRRDTTIALGSSFMFVGRRHVPLAFVRQSPNLSTVASYVEAFKTILPRDGVGQRPWFDAPVGIVMMHRDLWHQCRGYDERLIYWGFMETDLGLRIAGRYQVVNIGPELGTNFYHLSHTTQRLKITQRTKNERAMPRAFAPNGASWGLVQYGLELRTAIPSRKALRKSARPMPGEWSLRARHGPDVIRESLWEAGLALTRVGRMLVLGDRIQPTPKPAQATLTEVVAP